MVCAMLLVGCASATPSNSCVPSWLVVESVCDPAIPLPRDVSRLPRPLPQEEMSVGIDFIAAGRLLMGRAPPPCPAELPFDPPPCELDGRYQLIVELGFAIAARPDDPSGYELRATLWDDLGWRVRADRDRAIAKLLRAVKKGVTP